MADETMVGIVHQTEETETGMRLEGGTTGITVKGIGNGQENEATTGTRIEGMTVKEIGMDGKTRSRQAMALQIL